MLYFLLHFLTLSAAAAIGFVMGALMVDGRWRDRIRKHHIDITV